MAAELHADPLSPICKEDRPSYYNITFMGQGKIISSRPHISTQIRNNHDFDDYFSYIVGEP